MLVIKQDVDATRVGSAGNGIARRFELRRWCEICGTILSRYNSSKRYCFVHDSGFAHLR